MRRPDRKVGGRPDGDEAPGRPSGLGGGCAPANQEEDAEVLLGPGKAECKRLDGPPTL